MWKVYIVLVGIRPQPPEIACVFSQRNYAWLWCMRYLKKHPAEWEEHSDLWTNGQGTTLYIDEFDVRHGPEAKK